MKLQKYSKNRSNLNNVPQDAGVYIFWNKASVPIYVGKANNLKKRLESYFSNKIFGKTLQMMTEATGFSIIRVDCEIEALLLEAKLVNQFQSKFNSQLKDDKRPLYIIITPDTYPQVLIARKKDRSDRSLFYGPFPSSTSVKTVLKLIRRIFPYSQHKIGNRACLYSQIGLCNPCPNEIEKIKDRQEKDRLQKKYKRNIKMIKTFLSGDLYKVKRSLEKEMNGLAKNEDFEEAKAVREKIKSIEYITQPITPINYFLENPNFLEDIRKKEEEELTNILRKFFQITYSISRIECFDVAHLGGTSVTASMVTFINGEPEKSLYRHFRVRQKKSRDDISSLSEIAQRRLKNKETWGLPNLIVVDGGKGQLKTFLEEFKNIDLPIVGLAKREETLVMATLKGNKISFQTLKLARGPARNLLQRIRNEAHRFARRYHFNLVKKMLIPRSYKKKL
ncbi:hypothetical protein A2962_00090 [Candidatus Woesebacteria bacterium RIFCSPLOWO2_01_FULL_39_61]|uniref:Excinuclease ABC subunit C n=1 Tax=Candidatus Woesebacteria bacterium RIFCSPHIGHO2_02_FULL_39_13 TaxID=1802505 RepID=A0A1F7Z221_9BACT|nr:MAG: hypothetical protein A2692_02505 [Candidatus Woesebacteria bacterium RIFCSPHIGHO2_01_FULL_39_95]OGM33686.1 MAG: hypothetical protein A3D01_06070 [Candidatus Woesebacteria bacterium RIFCSPHIGHO2_02_FULL_39_13]OGM38922.1 MAG: hypothetical protein A3E13_02220 [Candidatus Woesebacteria bacterium RIFCSPHIGHO2_12_FULL_40_20]OGM68134.1 MAG: hypothetical protein A2962_00090 [Candidatus Woesebacteria bacterium RIFCSPLOWO2_01_FULL_39_61]